MPIRFSTEAANADHMRPDGDSSVAPEGMSREPKGGEGKAADDKAAGGKPGKDINAPGFIKDRDADKP
jgi:hypothetical protein